MWSPSRSTGPERQWGQRWKPLPARPDACKLQFYLDNYAELFAPLVDKEIRLLELGILEGGSLLLWRDYFERGVIVGLDQEAVPVEDSTGRVHVYQGSQQDIALLDQIGREMAPDGFDIIIDDCSHIAELTRVTLRHLFDHHLKVGGLYVIEDWGTGYLEDWDDGASYTGRNHLAGMVGLVKELVDECSIRDVTWLDVDPAITPFERPLLSSKFERMLITPGQVFIVKASPPGAASLSEGAARREQEHRRDLDALGARAAFPAGRQRVPTVGMPPEDARPDANGGGIYGQFWDRYVGTWTPDEHEWPGDEWGSPDWWENVYQKYFVRAGAAHWQRAVEIGPGSGKYTLKLLAGSPATVRAYDVSRKFMEVCEGRCGEWIRQGRLSLHLLRGGRADEILSDLRARGWLRTVDGFYSIDAMVHVDLQYLIVYLLTASLALKPGGKLILSLADATSELGFKQLLEDIAETYPVQGQPSGKFEWLSPGMIGSVLARLGFTLDAVTNESQDFHLLASLTDPTAADGLQRYLR